jgi:hypothetical protein
MVGKTGGQRPCQSARGGTGGRPQVCQIPCGTADSRRSRSHPGCGRPYVSGSLPRATARSRRFVCRARHPGPADAPCRTPRDPSGLPVAHRRASRPDMGLFSGDNGPPSVALDFAGLLVPARPLTERQVPSVPPAVIRTGGVLIAGSRQIFHDPTPPHETTPLWRHQVAKAAGGRGHSPDFFSCCRTPGKKDRRRIRGPGGLPVPLVPLGCEGGCHAAADLVFDRRLRIDSGTPSWAHGCARSNESCSSGDRR